MNEGSKNFLVGVFVGAALIFLLIYVVDPKGTHEREAVKHGAASYYLDENNVRRWGWNDDLAKGKK